MIRPATNPPAKSLPMDCPVIIPMTISVMLGGIRIPSVPADPMDPKIIDDISRRLAAALPPGFATLKDDLEKNIRAALDGIIGNMNLVSRQEFEIQQKVLERTRLKLEALERQLAELEKHI